MNVVAEERRIEKLRNLGISDPMIQLSKGKVLHECFRFACLGPPVYAYQGVEMPEGRQFLPLWDQDNHAVGVRGARKGLEFIEVDVEDAPEYVSLAETEQGFWVRQFDFLYETLTPIPELREAAEIVEFRFFDRYLQERERSEHLLGTFESHEAWLAGLVRAVERE